jgi:hypothetical protein
MIDFLSNSLVLEMSGNVSWEKAVLYGSADQTYDCPVFILPIAVAYRSCVDVVVSQAVDVGLLATHSCRDGMSLIFFFFFFCSRLRIGVDASFIHALAIIELLRIKRLAKFAPIEFVNNLINAARSIGMRTRLLTVISLLVRRFTFVSSFSL